MSPARVLIAGGGIAGLELLLALRAFAGHRVQVTLLTADPELAPRAMTVAEPFARGGARTHDWAQIARDQDASLVLDKLVAIDAAARIAFTHGGRRLHYDMLAITLGARRIDPLAGALTFGTGADVPARVRAIVDGLLARGGGSIAFALPFVSSWPLPLYELALLTAHDIREHGSTATIRIVSPERRPLELFGPAADEAISPMLEALGVEFVGDAQPREVAGGGVRLDGAEIVPADHVVTLADIVARSIPGLPFDRCGFVPVDVYGRVAGEPAVYAAGEATSFPLRQGGLATQQADAVAEAIAAAAGADNEPQPFCPVLRGRLLTAGAPLYLHARPSGQSVASTRALWSPPGKIAGRYLAPYLATARASRLESLRELVPALPGAGAAEHDAMKLACQVARAEARCGNAARAAQAIDASAALRAGSGRPGRLPASVL